LNSSKWLLDPLTDEEEPFNEGGPSDYASNGWLRGPGGTAFDTTVNGVVVDGAITDAVEQQPIRLNRSKANPLPDRFGTGATPAKCLPNL